MKNTAHRLRKFKFRQAEQGVFLPNGLGGKTAVLKRESQWGEKQGEPPSAVQWKIWEIRISPEK